MSSVHFCLATYQLQRENMIKKSTSSGSMATGECTKKNVVLEFPFLLKSQLVNLITYISNTWCIEWIQKTVVCSPYLGEYLVPQHHSTACRLLHEVWNMLMALVDSTTFLDISREIRRIESVLSHCLCRRCSEIMKKGILVFLICVLFKSCLCVFWLQKSLLFSKPLSHITWPRLSI